RLNFDDRPFSQSIEVTQAHMFGAELGVLICTAQRSTVSIEVDEQMGDGVEFVTLVIHDKDVLVTNQAIAVVPRLHSCRKMFPLPLGKTAGLVPPVIMRLKLTAGSEKIARGIVCKRLRRLVDICEMLRELDDDASRMLFSYDVLLPSGMFRKIWIVVFVGILNIGGIAD